MQKNSTSVDVIIPVYGRYDILLETLESVFSQNRKFKLNVIVVDDNYPEPAAKTIKKHYPDVKVIRNNKNLRSGPSRNRALKLLKSEYVAFLDSDDVWQPDFIDESIKKIKNEKIVGATVSLSKPLFGKKLPLIFKLKIYLLSAIRDFFQITFLVFNNGYVPRSAFYLCQLSHLVFKREVVGGIKFDEDYNFGGEDWKFVLEVMGRTNLSIVPKRLVNYRYHQKSTILKSKNLKNKWKSYSQLFDELDKRYIKGLMVNLFRLYIKSFQ